VTNAADAITPTIRRNFRALKANDPPERVEPVEAGTTPRAADTYREISTMNRTSTRLPHRIEHLRRAPDSNRILLVKQDVAGISCPQRACLLQPSYGAL